MNTMQIKRQFAMIGAQSMVREDLGRRARTGVAVDIGRDGEGEYFDIALGHRARSALSVVDAQPRLRHLLLMARQSDGKHKFFAMRHVTFID